MSRATLLIVEDEEIVAADLASKLGRLGYAVSGSTARGEEAVSLARQLRPDLVLMDIRLKGTMDGVAAAELIRRECDLPVIYLTAHSDRPTLQRAKLTEPFGYILKPFAELELETHIEMALYKHQAERKLRDSERRERQRAADLATMLDAVPMPVIIVNDPDSRHMTGNPAAEALLGIPRGAEISLSAPPETKPRHFKTLKDGRELRLDELPAQRAARGEQVQDFEFRLAFDDGTVRDLLGYGTPLLDEQGRPRGAVHVLVDITARKQVENALSFLARCGLTPGEDFFQALGRYLGETLGMDFVCIDRLEGGGLTAQTEAMFVNGKFEDNVSYALKDTPCGDVVGKAVCCFPAGVRHLFPKDTVLQDMAAESYVGVTLWGHTGKPIGLIAIIGRRPLTSPQIAESILKVVAVRAAGELERKQAEEALRQSNEELTHFNAVMVGRELRMVELKKEVNRLCAQAGQPPRYPLEAELEQA